MAIRIEPGEGLVRTSSLPNYNQPYTLMGWFRTESSTQFGTYFNQWAGSYQNQDALHRNNTASEISLEVWNGGGGIGLYGPAIPLGTWTHYAIVRSGATDCRLYIDGALIGVNSFDITGRTAQTEIRIGWTTVSLDARVAAVKAWSVALSAAEVAREVETIRPIRTASLHGFWPLFPGSTERTWDYSGNARHWTEVGTLTDEAPPPVPWGARVYVLSPPASLVRTIPTLTIPTAIPAPTVTVGAGGAPRTITPSPVVVNLAIPAPTAQRTLVRTPSPVTVPLAVPAPTVTQGAPGARTITPSPVVVNLALPAPTRVAGPITKTPSPVVVPLALPTPTITRVKRLTPAPVTVPLVLPALTITKAKTLTPSPVAIPLLLPAITKVQGARTIRPDPVPIRLELPAPKLVGFFDLVVVDQVLVDWNQDGDFTDPEDNITPYVRAWVVDRGRDSPNALAGRSLAGRFEVLLDNRDGRFSEFNPASPYFGSIHTGVPIRLTITTPAAGTQFEGQLESIQPTSSLGGDHTATLVAYGPLGAFAQDAAGGSGNNISTELYTSLYTSDAVGHILDAAGWSATKRAIAPTGQPLITWWADTANPLTALRELEDIEQGFIYETKDGKIAWENRYFRYGLTSRATYSDTPGSPLSYLPLQSQAPARYIVNTVEVVVEPPTATSSDLLVLWLGQLPMSVAPGEAVTIIAVADLALVANAFGVSSWTTPVLGTDYGAWSNADGTGTDLSASVTLTVQKQSTRMYMTFTNTHATLTAYITPLQARGRLAVKHNAVVVEAHDDPSQLQHGRKSRQLQGGRYLADRSTARSIAQLVVLQNKTPHPAFYMPVIPATPAQLIDLLSRDLSQRVTLQASVARTGFGVSADFIVESIHLELPTDRVLRGRLGLSAQEIYLGSGGTPSNFFILDTSALDGPDILGF
jgi:Concanavalin A-like lectin/glucanases superfamily